MCAWDRSGCFLGILASTQAGDVLCVITSDKSRVAAEARVPAGCGCRPRVLQALADEEMGLA